jgi:hypothetical protein
MGKFSTNEDATVHKLELARIQLEDAVHLFLMGKYLSALTLAGAADGIMEGYMTSKDLKTAAEETWAEIETVRQKTGFAFAGTRTRKDAFKEWNEKKNRAKHHNKEESDMIPIDSFDAAYEMIQRANADADRLGVVTCNRQEYENWLIANIYK